MSSPDDALLDSLTSDLKPVKRLRSSSLWIGAAVGLVVALVYIFVLYGPRGDIVAMMRGGALVNPMVIGKPLIFLISGLSALWAVSGLARPEGQLKLVYMLPVLAVSGLLVGNLLSDMAIFGTSNFARQLNGGGHVCFITILCGGMAGLVVMWRLWLRRAATSHPVLLGAMSGMATASLMAAAYAIHCNMDASIYILLFYGTAVAVSSGIAALLGLKLLKW
jgi:hypothetical protein